MSETVKTALTPKEIACLTAGVPCSGSPDIDAIITQGLRFKAAVEILAGMYASEGYHSPSVENATAAADRLLKAFRE
jgi:hypothetical protein